MRTLSMSVVCVVACIHPTLNADDQSPEPPTTRSAESAPQMIAVEFKLIEISKSKMSKLGLDFATFDGHDVKSLNGTNAFDQISIVEAAGLVEALLKNNIGRVLASPTIATLSGEEASLSIGSQSETNISENEAESGKLGTKMWVRPVLLESDRIKIDIRLEWSENERVQTAEQEVEDHHRQFELQTTIAPQLGKSTLLARPLEIENQSDFVVLVVTPEVIETTADAKQSDVK